jgi:glycerophosphoryl diester phosphodiesterase
MVLSVTGADLMLAIAHRGNLSGVDVQSENSLDQISRALNSGFGVETDIRRSQSGDFYISHDHVPLSECNAAREHARLWRSHPDRVVALNIKELGYEAELLAFLESEKVCDQVFLFDMDMIESEPGKAGRLLKSLHPSIDLAVRVSDRGEFLDRALGAEWANTVWLDEFDSPWIDEAGILRLKETRKTIYAVSLEIHGFPLDLARQRWLQLAAWGVDGICTDWPKELARVAHATCRLDGEGDQK